MPSFMTRRPAKLAPRSCNACSTRCWCGLCESLLYQLFKGVADLFVRDGVGKSYLLDLQDEADDELDKTDWSKLQQDFGGVVGQSAASNEA